MSNLKVGIIGIGGFGSRAAMRLLWTDFPDLMVYDTHEQTPRVFTGTYGGMSLGSPTMMAQLCDIIITALPGTAEMREVFFGWEGLATGFKKASDPGRQGLVMDIGTTDPLQTVAMAKELAAHNVQFVDAPAFGTPAEAREGKLTMVVGGEDDAVARSAPILEKLATRIIRAGATGSAQAAAALADYMRAARLLAASEAIRLGGHFGFEPANLLAACDALGGAALPQLLEEHVATRRFKTGQQLGNLHANVALAEKLASGAGLPSPLLTATRDALNQAEQRLGYSQDITALIKWLETLTPPQEQAAEAAKKETGPA